MDENQKKLKDYEEKLATLEKEKENNTKEINRLKNLLNNVKEEKLELNNMNASLNVEKIELSEKLEKKTTK